MTSELNNFNSQSADEALIQNAQNGNIKAETFLLQKYRPLIASIASKYSGVALDKDDIIQEGFFGLLSAIYTFSKEKNVTFRTYSAVCISNSIKTALKAESTLKNSPLNTSVPIEDNTIISDVSPEKLIIAQENSLRIKNIINKNLSSLEKKVLYEHIAGKTYKEISASLGKSEKSVDNALQRIRLKLSKLLKDDES